MEPARKHDPVYDDDSSQPMIRPNLHAIEGGGEVSEPRSSHLQSVPTGDDLRGAEEQAGSGGAGGSSGLQLIKGGKGSKTGTGDLKQQEQDSGKPSSSDDEPQGKKTGKGWGKLSRRKRMAITGVAGLTIIGGGGMSLFAIVSGPLQLIHAAQLLQQFHFDDKNGQSEHRTIRLARNIRYLAKKEPQKTRMGYLGNKIADKIEAKFNAYGIESQYSGTHGIFQGYKIDPEKLQGEDFDQLKDRSPESVKQYLQEKYGINAEIQGKTLMVKGNSLPYKQERLLLKSTMELAGYHGMTGAVGARIMGVRNLVSWHPIKRMDKKILDTVDKRLAEWKKRMREKIGRGTRPPSLTAEADKNKNGDPNQNADGNTSDTQEIIDEANQAATDEANGKTGALDAFRNSLLGKFSIGASAIVGIVCLAQYIAAHIDDVNMAVVIKPMIRMGMDTIATGNQVENGTDGDEEQFGFAANTLYDAKTQTSWTDARSIQAELGQNLSGPDIPPADRIDPAGNIVTRFIDAIPGVDSVCKAANSVVGQVIVTGLGLVTGPISTIVTTVVGALGMPYLVDMLTKYFAADAVDPLAQGALKGNLMNYGARLAARDMALTNGGLPISAAEEKTIADNEADIQNIEFQQHSLAYRLFDAKDSRSLIAKVIDSQTPDPFENIARMSTSLLNVTHTFSSLVSAPFSKVLHAAPIRDYDYGFPDYAFTDAEMNDARFGNPYQNADMAAQALDASQASGPESADNLVYRAKVCFGVDIEKAAPADQPDNPQWYIAPPVADQTPTQKTIQDSANKCTDQSEQWTRVRFFIMDSNMMNSLACYESVGDDPSLTQACVDIGLEPNPNTGGGAGTTTDSSTGVPTCGTTAASSAPAGYHLTGCEDFEGTSLPAGWGAYNGGGGGTVVGAGRKASQCTVGSSIVTLTQTSDGSTCGMSWNMGQKYGYWETRMRAYGTGGSGSAPHPVLILWPDSERGPGPDGEYDYFETDIGSPAAGFLHCGASGGNCFVIPNNPVDYSQFHNYAIEWAPDHLSGFIDGKQWWTSSDPKLQAPGPMHQTIQLDNLSGKTPVAPAKMEVDWVHVYAK